jgi:hypothetical protein
VKKRKYLLLLACSFFIFSQLSAQEKKEKKQDSLEMQTVFNNKNRANGGYGAFHFGYSVIGGRDALITGFRGGWIVNHQFVLGFAGTSFITEEKKNNLPLLNNYLTGGYGGFLIEPILFPEKPVHVSFPMIFGGGGVVVLDADQWMNGDNHYDPFYTSMNNFFIFNPGVEIEFNMARVFRLGIGLSYRLTSAVDLPNYDASLMRGGDVYLIFKFGKF